MKKRNAFTLLELSVATAISSFVMISMASIYTAANKHVFQSYRSDAVKGGVSLSMRAMRQVMAQATRIDQPANGSTGTRLAVASNVDALTGCHPIATTSFDTDAPAPKWHLFCIDSSNPNNLRLYYHSGNISTSCGCPGPCFFNNPANTTACGSAGGVLLGQYLTAGSGFSRVAGSVPGPTAVRASIHSIWNSGGSVSPTQHAVDYSLDGVFSAAYGRNW